MTEFIPPEKKLIRYTAPHILQTDAWGELKSAFGWYAVRAEAGSVSAQILFRKLPLGLTIAYIPKPPVSLFRKSVALGEEVDRICKANKAIFLKVEPDEWEDADQQYALEGWRIGDPIQPPRTIVIDLRGTEDEILGRMKQKTRYNIRLAEKKGVSVRKWDDVAAFFEMMQVTGGRDGFGVHSQEYYQRAYELFVGSEAAAKSAELFVAEYEGKPLGAVMVFISGNRAWYMYGASNNQERNRMPTYLVQWEAMRWAKERGADLYDLYGVPDHDEAHLEKHFNGTQRNEGLWGVYRFKRGFGGEVKRAAQALDRVYKPLLYAVYRNVKK